MIDIVKQIRNENGIIILDDDCEQDSYVQPRMYIDVRWDYFLKDAFRECKKKKFDPIKANEGITFI